MKKSSKISEIERLHLEKMRLQREADASLNRLDSHWDYLQENFGSLAMRTATSAVVSKLPPAIQGFIPSFSSGDHKGMSSQTGVVIDQVLDFVPMFFKGVKPMVIVFLLKKLKNIFIHKKTKSPEAED